MDTDSDRIRLIAFYLPQFHPIPENDAWWGPGFTDWFNVVRTRPLFPDHYQPHLPADLGFYDLRLPEVRQAQADLARQYGIHGFCYYHYWFRGKRLLSRPFEEVLESGQPDFPFCLCWANESWTRRWDGLDNETLIEQTYGSDRHNLDHIRWLLQAFADPRYIRVNGRPLFLVYRTKDLPEPERTLGTWRQEADRAGFPGLYICSVDSSWARNWDPTPHGFDAAVEFQPAFTLLPPQLLERRLSRRRIWQRISRQQDKIVSYQAFVRFMLQREYPPYKMFRCVTPGFDNSPRRRGLSASILHRSNPQDFGRWLDHSVRWTGSSMKGDERILFINAWNEWAEGNHLEPDQRFGSAFLEQVQRALVRWENGQVAK